MSFLNPLNVELYDRVKIKGITRHFEVRDYNSSTGEVWLEDRKGNRIKDKLQNVERIVDFKGGFLNYGK